MQPANYDATVYQGEDWSRVFTWPTSYDLTAYTEIKIEVRNKSGGTVLNTFTVGSGLTISGADNNVLTWDMSNTQTAALPTHYAPVYDVRTIDASGKHLYWFKGTITTTAGITES